MCFPKTIKQKKNDQQKIEGLLSSIDSYRSWYHNYSVVRQANIRNRTTMSAANGQQESQSQDQLRQPELEREISQQIAQRLQRHEIFQWQLPVQRQRQQPNERLNSRSAQQPVVQQRLQPVTTSSNTSYFRRRSINIQPRPIHTYTPTQEDAAVLNQMMFTRNIFQRMQFIADRETMDILLNPDSE